MNADQRLSELGIELPSASAPAGNYAAAIQSGDLLFLSGKSPLAVDGEAPKGRLGERYSTDEGYALARSACINLLATVKQSLGSLDRVAQVVELQGSLCTTAGFEDHAKVLDGASDLLLEIFGSSGMHARSVIGVHSLRNGVPLTIKATLQVKTA